MSFEATTWASSAVRGQGLKPASKLVLYHLADRHNPDFGCFPSQETLARDCEMSRSTLNEHLRLLEGKKLIRRESRRDERTNKQKSTRYILAFEEESGSQPPSKGRNSGVADPSSQPESEPRSATQNGHTVSGRPNTEPCPKNRKSRVRKTAKAVSGRPDTKPVIEPIKEPNASASDGAPRISENPNVVKEALRLAQTFREGRRSAFTEAAPWVRNHTVAAQLLTPDELVSAGLCNENQKTEAT